MSAIDETAVAAAVRQLLCALGADANSPELADTPARVAATFAEWCQGQGVDPQVHLRDLLPAGQQAGEFVALKDIEFQSLCEHHLLPFSGVAHVVYVPNEQLAGLGAIARVVQIAAARPQLQERLGTLIASSLERGLAARGVLVVLEAQHGCLSWRGPKQKATAVTVAAAGELSLPAGRQEALALLSCTDPQIDRQKDVANG